MQVWGLSPWRPLLGLISRDPIFKASHCISFEDQAPIYFIWWSSNDLRLSSRDLTMTMAPAMAAKQYAPLSQDWTRIQNMQPPLLNSGPLQTHYVMFTRTIHCIKVLNLLQHTSLHTIQRPIYRHGNHITYLEAGRTHFTSISLHNTRGLIVQ